MTQSIETTLKALDTDHLDVYLVHWPDRDTPYEETMRGLEDLVAQGKTRFVGVSNFQASRDRRLHGRPPGRRRTVRLQPV